MGLESHVSMHALYSSHLHHVVNEHEWALGKCCHELPAPELPEGKTWLKADSLLMLLFAMY